MPDKAFSVCIKDSVFIEPSCGIGIESNIETIYTLFKIDSKYGVYIGKFKERTFMFFEPQCYELKRMFECWHIEQTELKNGEISPEEYDLWKYGFGAVSDGANAEHLY